MTKELPDISDVPISTLVQAYLEQQGYEFQDSERVSEWVEAEFIEIGYEHSTTVYGPTSSGVWVNAEGLQRVREGKK